MFLFTRIQSPDALVTLCMLITLWGFLRALEGERSWAAIGAVAMGCGILLKALIAIVFPCAAMALFLALSGEWKQRQTWRRLHLASSVAIVAAISLPWHIAATLSNPPYFDLTWGSRPGEYHGFFWFYFLNEHVFRFLNMRHPRDYNTVPRALFWLLHLVWFFPWSGALAGAFGESFRGADRASRTRLLALCWAGFVLLFFSFSTTQEYYSMPAYPAFALLAGSAVASGSAAARIGLRAASVVFGLAGIAILAILGLVWGSVPQGDIAKSLTQTPEAYTLSMGHMGDLTLESFAHVKIPLLVALAACVAGVLARGRILTLALAMVVFVHAARLALIVFDPYLGSRELAEAYRKSPPGELIVDNQYYAFSSVFFYAGVQRAWLLNGRVNNLEYGSHAPGAPDVFLTNAELDRRWHSPQRYYLLVEEEARMKVGALIADALYLVKSSGGKYLYTNLPWRTPTSIP
jgi:4-amino-4-deoxy-L-arabinose transferase-like glycosyltransferase